MQIEMSDLNDIRRILEPQKKCDITSEMIAEMRKNRAIREAWKQGDRQNLTAEGKPLGLRTYLDFEEETPE
jgi:hypothetical protein